MNKKRILYIAGSSVISGGELCLLSLVVNLDRNMFDPLVLIPGEGNFAVKLRKFGIPINIKDIKPLTLISLNPFKLVKDLAHALIFALSLARYIKENNVDLIHVNSYRIGISCSLAARITSVPVVWHIHHIGTSSLKRLVIKVVTQVLSSATIAPSYAVAAELVENSPKISVIYNGINVSHFEIASGARQVRAELGISPSTLLIGNVGQFIPLKGQAMLIKAMVKVIAAVKKDVKLLLVGFNQTNVWKTPLVNIGYKKYLFELVDDLGLQDKVIFTGFREDIASVMKALDLYVHSAIHPEAFGRVVVEAMGAGKAVVGPDAGGISETVYSGRNGLLFPMGDIEKMTKAIISLLTDKKKRLQMGKAGIQIARQKFSVEAYVNQVEQIYIGLLGIS